MTTDDFTEAAHAVSLRANGMEQWDRDCFIAGAVCARDHLAAQEPTDAEVEAAGRVILACIWNGPEEDAPQDVIAYAWDQARAALSDARAARRDERGRP